MKTGEVCKHSVVTARPDTRLVEAARLMRDNHVGSLVVMDEKDERVPVGIVTDRDIVVAGIAAGLDQTLTLGEIMGAWIATARESDDAEDTLELMRERGVRRLPVVASRGELVGIVSIEDLLEAIARELADIVHAMRSGRAVEARIRT